MSRMERLEEAMSHQHQQSARMERLEEAMSQQQQSTGGMLTSGGVSQVSEQWQHNVGRTPSGDGALPPSLHVMGLTSFSAPSGAVSTGIVGSWQGGVTAGFGMGGRTSSPITAPLLSSVEPRPPLLYGDTPLSAFGSPTQMVTHTNAVVVGPCSPPIPGKIAEKIWRGEFIDLNALLPHRLGAPEPTLAEALQKRSRDLKQISTIEQWVVCFSAFMSVIALRIPGRIRDLLAYQALIVKAAHDYEGTPWLSYDAHFRSVAATMQLQTWSTPDQTIWSQYFNRANPRMAGSNALSVGPYGYSNQDDLRGVMATPARALARKERPLPYSRQAPICLRWNKEGCRSPDCTYRHMCLACHGPHREPQCSMGPTATMRNTPRQKPPFRKDFGPSAGVH